METCAECLGEFPSEELTDGLCWGCLEEEECPDCDGTGYNDDDDEEGGTGECESCGGDGYI